ncbi:hypothetical protein Micbo1qcDRAFT_210913 [Microdochium bolleyi]|uniref:Uncharacterized protein n=1 Tax=Microdochium bolleyi TaxID=196109 RepID=A0A136JHT1_9PEZI|nr:hypothetical protein Micbo1qcDRAFT_210913 [Microdochium bolleyi]
MPVASELATAFRLVRRAALVAKLTLGSRRKLVRTPSMAVVLLAFARQKPTNTPSQRVSIGGQMSLTVSATAAAPGEPFGTGYVSAGQHAEYFVECETCLHSGIEAASVSTEGMYSVLQSKDRHCGQGPGRAAPGANSLADRASGRLERSPSVVEVEPREQLVDPDFIIVSRV